MWKRIREGVPPAESSPDTDTYEMHPGADMAKAKRVALSVLPALTALREDMVCL